MNLVKYLKLIIIKMINVERSSLQHKCAKYWPDEGGKMYGDIEVQHLRQEMWPDFVVRTFRLKKVFNETKTSQCSRQLSGFLKHERIHFNDQFSELYSLSRNVIALL